MVVVVTDVSTPYSGSHLHSQSLKMTTAKGVETDLGGIRTRDFG